MMSCSGSYYVPSDNDYDYRYYDEYYYGYNPYPFNYQYRNYYNYPRNYYYVPQQNGDQINVQRGVRPSRTVIAPLGPPRRNVTPSRTITPSGTPSRTGRGN